MTEPRTMMRRHPRPAHLLLYAEGELAARRAEVIRRHLSTCESCQHTIRDVDVTLDRFRGDQRAAHRDAPPDWTGFRPALLQLMRQEARRRLPGHAWIRVAATIIAVAGVCLLSSRLVPRLSAHALLERSVAFERAAAPLARERIALRVSGPLARTLPCIGTGQTSITNSSITDSSLPLDRPDAVCSKLPLSANRFLAWSSAQLLSRMQVIEHETSTIISIDAHGGSLRHATLTMHRQTYQPIAGRLLFADGSEVEISVREEPATLRAGDSAAKIVAEPLAAAPAATPAAASAAVVVPRIHLEETELDVRMRLHRLGADLAEDVTIDRRADGTILVRGVVQTAARRTQILDALRGLPNVGSSLRAGDEPGLVTSSAAAIVAPVTLEPPLLAAWLKDHFSSSSEREAYVTQALTLSDAIVNRASALKSLADRYPSHVVAQLSARGRADLDRLVVDHEFALREAANELAAQLEPVWDESSKNIENAATSMGRADATRDDTVTTAGWSERAPDTLALARHVGRRLLELLTAHDAHVTLAHDGQPKSVSTGCGVDSTAASPVSVACLDATLRRLGAR